MAAFARRRPTLLRAGGFKAQKACRVCGEKILDRPFPSGKIRTAPVPAGFDSRAAPEPPEKPRNADCHAPSRATTDRRIAGRGRACSGGGEEPFCTALGRLPGTKELFPGTEKWFSSTGKWLLGTGERFSGTGERLPGTGKWFSGTGEWFLGTGERFLGTGERFSSTRERFPSAEEWPKTAHSRRPRPFSPEKRSFPHAHPVCWQRQGWKRFREQPSTSVLGKVPPHGQSPAWDGRTERSEEACRRQPEGHARRRVATVLPSPRDFVCKKTCSSQR